MAFVRRPLLLCSQGLVLVHVGYAGKVLMSDQIASQGRFGLVSKHNRLQDNSLQAIAAFAIHIVFSRFLVSWTIRTASVSKNLDAMRQNPARRNVSLRSRCAGEAFMEAEFTESIVLCRFLAIDAKRSLRHNLQTIPTDGFIASETEAVCPFFDARQGCLHETKLCEVMLQNPRGEVPLFSASNLVHDIRRALDCNNISIVDTFGKCIAPVFEYGSESLDLN
jgi:hypothetical protein